MVCPTCFMRILWIIWTCYESRQISRFVFVKSDSKVFENTLNKTVCALIWKMFRSLDVILYLDPMPSRPHYSITHLFWSVQTWNIYACLWLQVDAISANHYISWVYMLLDILTSSVKKCSLHAQKVTFRIKVEINIDGFSL